MNSRDRGIALGVVICGNEILLVRNTAHTNPKWKIPGGNIEKEESAEDAFIREIEEETGIKVKKSNTKLLFRVLAKSIRLHYFFVFAAIVDSFDGLRTTPVKDGDALLEVTAVNIEDIEQYPRLPQHKAMLTMAIEKIRA